MRNFFICSILSILQDHLFLFCLHSSSINEDASQLKETQKTEENDIFSQILPVKK